MSNHLSKNEQIKTEVALIKKEINEFQYNPHDIDYQFNQVIDWGVKLKHLAEKLKWIRETHEVYKKVEELNEKWENIGKNSFFAFEDETPKRKTYPNRSIRHKFTKEQIKLIRQSDKTNKEIAKIIKCSPSLICQIKNRNIYKKV